MNQPSTIHQSETCSGCELQRTCACRSRPGQATAVRKHDLNTYNLHSNSFGPCVPDSNLEEHNRLNWYGIIVTKDRYYRSSEKARTLRERPYCFNRLVRMHRSRICTVVTVTRLWAGRKRNLSLIPERVTKIFCSPKPV